MKEEHKTLINGIRKFTKYQIEQRKKLLNKLFKYIENYLNNSYDWSRTDILKYSMYGV